MATVFPYRWTKTKHLTERPPTHGHPPDAHPWIIPYFCAWSPTADPAIVFAKEPVVACVNADLVFLRVHSDQVYHLVYHAGGRRPSLSLVRHPDRPFHRCHYLSELGSIAILSRRRAGAGDDHDDDSTGFYVCSLDQELWYGLPGQRGHFKLCLYDSIDGEWSQETLRLDQLRNPQDKDTVFHYTEKVITLHDEQVVAFVDLWRGMVICNVNDGTKHEGSSYVPLPQDIINLDMINNGLIYRDIAVVNGRLTVVRLRSWLDSGCLSWDLTTWSKKAVTACLDEEWREDFVIAHLATCNNVELLPKLNDLPAMDKLRIARPMLSLMDSHVVYIMGKVNLSGEKTVVLTVDMANKRLQGVSLRDAERIVYDDNATNSLPSPNISLHLQPLPWILLDVRAYIADRRNSTTATIFLSNGRKIQITFCIAPPPLISYICAWSPATDPAVFFAKEPAVGFVNDNLVFLRVHSDQIYDLIYHASSRPSLKLIHNPYSPYNPYEYLRRIDNVVILPDRRHAAGADDDDNNNGHFYVSSLDRDRRFDIGHFKLCLYDEDDSMDCKWSNNILLLDQLRNAADKDIVLHLTEKVLILDDEQPLVAFVDPWRGMVICNVLDNSSTPGESSYMPMPSEIFNIHNTYTSSISRDIAIVNGRLTVVRLCLYLDSDDDSDDDDDDDCCAWDLTTWSKPVTCLDDEWREDLKTKSSDVSIDDSTRNACLLPKLDDGCPTTETLQLAHPTLSLMDAHIVYFMGKVDVSNEKALVLTVDMANKRLQEPPSHDGDAADHQNLPWILLDVRAYIADRRNSTTTTIDLSNSNGGRKMKIQITFCVAPPPLVSYICAWSPNTDPARIFAKEPDVGIVNDDLVFLRINGNGDDDDDYDLVYQAGCFPSLKLVDNPAKYLRELDNVALLPRRRRRSRRSASADDDSGFYICALDRDHPSGLGHFQSCLYDSIDGTWRLESLLLDELRNPPDKDTVLHFTEKVVVLPSSLDDGRVSVAFADLWRGIIICDDGMLDGGKPAGSYMPLPLEIIDLDRAYYSLACRDMAVVNGRLTVARMRIGFDSDTNCCSWDLSTWSKAVTCLDEEWREDFVVDSNDILVDEATCNNVELLPKLNDLPAMAKLRVAHPTLSLMDAHVVYIMGKVNLSDEKALVLTVDIANKRLREVSVYDAERIVNDFRYAYTAMATDFPYSFTRTKHLTLSPPSSHGGDAADHRPLPWILLDVRAYIADCRNSTTATIVLSNGRKIQITFCIAPPPLVSYICAWSPTTDPAVFFAKDPAVGFVDADVVFLRVHSDQIYDLVYHASSHPSLKLIHNPYSPYNPYHYLRRIDNVAILPDRRRRHAAGGADDDDDDNRGRFYVSSLDRDRRFDLGHFKLCLYDEDDSMDRKWSNTILLLDQLRNAPDKDTVLHLTEKVFILDDEQPLVAFVDLWRGIVICNVLDNSTPVGGNYMPLPPELIDVRRTYNSYDDDSDDDDYCTWDLTTWSKPVSSCLDDEWREDFMIESSDVSIDDSTRNACLLPKLDDGCPTTETLQLAHPTLSLMDAHIVYIMGKVDVSDEKALVLTVDMANKRLQEGNLKRPLKFHMQYPHKRLGETISRSDNPIDLHEPLQLDTGSGMGTKDETEDSVIPMDLE
uniref:DUF1618 domain-containing protein n=1 Tax=Oryza barthii TaxID=65489 RepID=A0A0D3H9Y1_9ORYZ